jgi:hypothetical protein
MTDTAAVEPTTTVEEGVLASEWLWRRRAKREPFFAPFPAVRDGTVGCDWTDESHNVIPLLFSISLAEWSSEFVVQPLSCSY